METPLTATITNKQAGPDDQLPWRWDVSATGTEESLGGGWSQTKPEAVSAAKKWAVWYRESKAREHSEQIAV